MTIMTIYRLNCREKIQKIFLNTKLILPFNLYYSFQSIREGGQNHECI